MDNTRIEIDPSAFYILWAGEGIISEENPGIFSVRNIGQAHFDGDLRPEVIRTAVQNPSWSNGAVAQTDPVFVPAGFSKRVSVSMLYENSGFRSSPLTGGNPSCEIQLDFAFGTGSIVWTPLTSFPVSGTTTNTLSGSGYQTAIRMGNSITFTHNDSRGGRFIYRASIKFPSGPWPVIIGSSRGKQRLGLQVVTLN